MRGLESFSLGQSFATKQSFTTECALFSYPGVSTLLLTEGVRCFLTEGFQPYCSPRGFNLIAYRGCASFSYRGRCFPTEVFGTEVF